MEYNFDTMFFPIIQWISIGFLILGLICFLFAVLKDNKIIYIITVILWISGFLLNLNTRYVIRDYIVNQNYDIVVAEPGLTKNTYKSIKKDYQYYWNHMNWKTYRLDKENKTIYMKINRYY